MTDELLLAGIGLWQSQLNTGSGVLELEFVEAERFERIDCSWR
jgi:hypothetical protein